MENKNALERFIRKTHELFAGEPDLDKRWAAELCRRRACRYPLAIRSISRFSRRRTV